MKAHTVTGKDGIVTIVVEPEGDIERQLLSVFSAQTRGARSPALVLDLGNAWKLQLVPKSMYEAQAACVEARSEV